MINECTPLLKIKDKQLPLYIMKPPSRKITIEQLSDRSKYEQLSIRSKYSNFHE